MVPGKGLTAQTAASITAALRRGDYRAVHEMLKAISDSPDGLRRLETVLSGMSDKPGTSERLELARCVSAAGLHPEALELIDEEMVLDAARNDASVDLAALFSCAQLGQEFIRRFTRGRSPAFLHTYARAFDKSGDPETGLRILKLKDQLSPEDFRLMFGMLGRLDRLRKLNPAALPPDQHPHLAAALFDAGATAEAKTILEKAADKDWGTLEFAAALRVRQGMGQYAEALALFRAVQRRLPLDSSAELHRSFARFSKSLGKRDLAQRIFAHLEEVLGPQFDVPIEVKIRQAGAKAGCIAGRYQILAPLEEGGMGEVFKAKDLGLPREVALKRIRDTFAGDAVMRQCFLQEACLLAALRHPNIMSIIDLLHSEESYWMVCEFIHGQTLASRIKDRGSVASRTVISYMTQICLALAYAHSQRVIHLDLKPANIIRDWHGQLKVMDFGLARYATEASPARESIASWGTVDYMAPEQHEGKATPLSDIYTLGVTAYELLAGALPFGEVDRRALKQMKRAERYQPLPDSIPAGLRGIIRSCMRSDPQERPKTARELLDRLEQLR